MTSNVLRAVRFERPDYIPMRVTINAACYHHYDQNFLFDMQQSHPLLFPGFVRPKQPYVPIYSLVARKDEPYTDDFGCLWKTSDNGITGTVVGHPLAHWDDYARYEFPNPERCMGIGPINWAREEEQIRSEKTAGHFVIRGLRHGHTFLQLSDMRGYDNLLFDMVDEEPRLYNLIEKLEAFNAHIIARYVNLGADMLSYPEDLGMQKGPMLSPRMFCVYIQLSYRRLMAIARKRGLAVHMHSDGDIRDLADDLIEGGVEVLNLQDLVNGIEWIRDRFKGKTCIDLDVDRQQVTVFGTPQQVDDLIRYEISQLGSREGGLMMTFGLYPGTPTANVKALFDALEKYAFYFN